MTRQSNGTGNASGGPAVGVDALDGSLGAAERREAAARFNAFYDYAFPRIYRYARRRMPDEAAAQALCRLVFVRIVTSLGDLELIEHLVERLAEQPSERDELEVAYWLFDWTRGTADWLLEQFAENPELIGTADLDVRLEDSALEWLRTTFDSADRRPLVEEHLPTPGTLDPE